MMDPSEVENRLLRAFKTIQALPDPEARFFRFGSLWPVTPQSAEDAYGYHEARRPKFRPTPYDVSDCLTALGWLRGIERREWKLIQWRSWGYSFRYMDLKLGREDGRALKRYRDLILNIWCNAIHNGENNSRFSARIKVSGSHLPKFARVLPLKGDHGPYHQTES